MLDVHNNLPEAKDLLVFSKFNGPFWSLEKLWNIGSFELWMKIKAFTCSPMKLSYK